MMHTKPATVAGMVALLDYLAKFDNPALFWGDDYEGSHDRYSNSFATFATGSRE